MIVAHADKVEKGLLKNLFIGYVVAPNKNDQFQIMKLITAVLEFTQAEIDRVGLNRNSAAGWLNSIRNAAVSVGSNPSIRDNGNIRLHLLKCVFAFIFVRTQMSTIKKVWRKRSSSFWKKNHSHDRQLVLNNRQHC